MEPQEAQYRSGHQEVHVVRILCVAPLQLGDATIPHPSLPMYWGRPEANHPTQGVACKAGIAWTKPRVHQNKSARHA